MTWVSEVAQLVCILGMLYILVIIACYGIWHYVCKPLDRETEELVRKHYGRNHGVHGA